MSQYRGSIQPTRLQPAGSVTRLNLSIDLEQTRANPAAEALAWSRHPVDALGTLRLDMNLRDAEELAESLSALITMARQSLRDQAVRPTALANAGVKVGADRTETRSAQSSLFPRTARFGLPVYAAVQAGTFGIIELAE